MGRTPLVIALAAAIALVAPAVAGGADPRVIAAGTSAGGVDLSGLTIDEAAGRLDAELAPKIAAPVVVTVAGRQFTLSPSDARVKFDPRMTAERAFYQGRTGVHDVPLAIEHSDDAVRAFVHDVDGRVGRPARNARVRITLERIVRVRARNGIGISEARLVKRIAFALDHPNAAWAGSLAGQVIPGGAPNNPLKARWLGITDGVGIHGTGEDWSIGSRASHGCIRMHVHDVIALYLRVPVGTPVLIR